MSLVPPEFRLETDVYQPIEHFTVFFVTGLALGLGYPSRYEVLGAALLLFALFVELAQLWIPGRHARLSDFVVNLLGLATGLGLAYIVTARTKGR